MPNRILIVTHEMLPFDDGPASGGGLRVWGLAQGLESRGFEVVTSMPQHYLEGRQDVPQAIREAAYDQRHMGRLIDKIKPDVLLLEQPRSLLWFENLDVPVVIDLPGPLFLEDRFIREGSQEEVLDKIHSLSYGDLFLTSHERQRSYFLSWLALAGVNLLEQHVQVVPFCLSPDSPPAQARSPEPTFIYSGFFHSWQNPGPALRILVETLEQRQSGRLEIIGGRHPADVYGEGRYLDPRTMLPDSSRISYHEPMPWPALCERLTRGWVGLNLLEPNVERENAFPIREINYLWCGLAPMVSPQSPLGPELVSSGAGWVVDHRDPEAMRARINQLLDQPALIDQASQAARALAHKRYNWEVAIEPLAEFCANPVRRRGKGRSFLVAVTDREQLVTVSEELGKVAEAQRHTEQELERRNEDFVRLEQELTGARETLDAQVAQTEQATAQSAEHEANVARIVVEQETLHETLQARTEALSETQRMQSQQQAELLDAQGTVAHKDDVIRRLTGDLEQQRRQIDGLEHALNHIRRKYLYRIYQKLKPLGRPAGLVALALVALLLSAWVAPDAVKALRTLERNHPTSFLVGAIAVALGTLATFYKFRRQIPEALTFKWRWLTPTRSRWLGAIKLCLLFVMSLVLMVYLKIWEKIHRIRVFP